MDIIFIIHSMERFLLLIFSFYVVSLINWMSLNILFSFSFFRICNDEISEIISILFENSHDRFTFFKLGNRGLKE